MATISLTLPVAGTVITAGLHATNYTAIQGAINGGLDNNNIAGGAAIDYSKLSVPAGAIVQSKITFDAWQAYTPAWTTTGVAPAVGNGSLTGKYVQIGKTVHGRFLLTAGSSTTFGTNPWLVSLPVAANAGFTIGVIGVVSAVDTSAGSVYDGFLRFASGTQMSLDTTSSPIANFLATAPVTWATGDAIQGSFTYEAA